jgi:hypothetical protein
VFRIAVDDRVPVAVFEDPAGKDPTVLQVEFVRRGRNGEEKEGENGESALWPKPRLRLSLT